MLESRSDFEKFIKVRPEIKNKAIILTKSKYTSKVIKGLSAEFKDRLDIAQLPSSSNFANYFQV